jgi:hypothetical protein
LQEIRRGHQLKIKKKLLESCREKDRLIELICHHINKIIVN